MPKTIEDFVYTPRSIWTSKNWKPDLKRCRYSVSDIGRMISWHQCTRKAVEDVEGYGWCKAHATTIKALFELSEGETFIKYAATFDYEKPILIELQLFSETEKMMNVSSAKNLMGDYNQFISGQQMKNSRYLRSYKYFDQYNESLVWLYNQALSSHLNKEKEMEKLKDVINSLSTKIDQHGTLE